MPKIYFKCPNPPTPPTPTPPSATLSIVGTELVSIDVNGTSDGTTSCSSFDTLVTSVSYDDISYTPISETLPLQLCGFNIQSYIPDLTNKQAVTIYIKRILVDCGGTAIVDFSFTVDVTKGIISAVNGVSCTSLTNPKSQK